MTHHSLGQRGPVGDPGRPGYPGVPGVKGSQGEKGDPGKFCLRPCDTPLGLRTLKGQ